MPPATGVLVPGLAVALGQLQPANPPHALQADISEIRDFLCDLRRIAGPGEIACSNAQTLAFLELPHMGQGGAKIARVQQRLQPGVDFREHPLFPAREPEYLGVHRRQPMGMSDKQSAQGL